MRYILVLFCCLLQQGSIVERAWGCLHAVLEGHKEYNEESHLVNTLPVMKALKSTLLNLCTKCFSIGVEKRSNPHMKLFAAAMKLSYELELGLPELVAPVLCMSSTAKSDDSSVSSLFVLLSSTHEKFCTINDTLLMDYTDFLIESMVWIAISGKSHDAAIEMITDFCDVSFMVHLCNHLFFLILWYCKYSNPIVIACTCTLCLFYVFITALPHNAACIFLQGTYAMYVRMYIIHKYVHMYAC